MPRSNRDGADEEVERRGTRWPQPSLSSLTAVEDQSSHPSSNRPSKILKKLTLKHMGLQPLAITPGLGALLPTWEHCLQVAQS